MRKYENIFVAHPSLDEEAVKALIEKFKGVIENGTAPTLASQSQPPNLNGAVASTYEE